MILVVAGDSAADEVLKAAEEFFGAVPRAGGVNIALPEEPILLGPRTMIKEEDVSLAYLHMAYRTIPLAHPDLYPLDIISYVLSNGGSSRLVRVIRDEKQLVHSIGTSSHTPGYDAGVFSIVVTLDPAKYEPARQAILAELERMKVEPVTDEELATAKKQKVADLIMGLQTVEAQAADVGINIIAANDPNFSETYARKIQDVTKDEIMAAARKYFPPDRLCITMLRPRTAKDAAKEQAVTSEAVGMQIFTLPNGLRLLLQRHPEPRAVSIQAYFMGGVLAEGPNENGLCNLTGQMLVRGTETRSAQDILGTFDSIGGGIGSAGGNNTLYVRASCLSEDIDTALEIFADVIINPAFDGEELEKRRALLLAAIRREEDDLFGQARRYFRGLFYEAGPYGSVPLGTKESLGAITREHLMSFHAKSCVPNNMVLAIVGDVDIDVVREKVEVLFGGMQRAEPFALPSVEPRTQAGETHVLETTKKMAAVIVGYPGMTLADVDDRYAIKVLDSLVSGVRLPTGWLHKELRGKGLVYVVHAYNWVGPIPGHFEVYAECEPEQAENVSNLITSILARVASASLTDGELGKAKEQCIVAKHLEDQTNSAIAARAALDELYGLGYEFSREYEQRIRAVPADEIKRVATKYLNNPVIAITSPLKPAPLPSE